MATEQPQGRRQQTFRWIEEQLPVEWTLTVPAVVLLLAATVLPLLALVWISLTDLNLVTSVNMNFIGLENYRSNIFQSERARSALLTTGIFIVSAVSIQLVLGFLLALLLWGRPQRRRIFLPILLMPMFVTWIAVGLMFRFMFQSGIGIVPHLLSQIGINIAWLSNPTYALAAIIIADIWEWTSFMTIMLLAGLEGLPEAPHEAARTDGAGRIEMFFDVTLPMMYPVIGVAVFVRLIEASKVFPKVLAMTEGGPGSSTETISYIIYEIGFRDFGIATAASQAVTVTLMLLALLYVVYRSGGMEDVF
jgi:multiple sugar transport system permease protein